jgi:nitrate/TMAO reductase-like tetraheme cytochrome c subunit
MNKKVVYFCINCHGLLKYYDSVKQILRTKNRKTTWVILPRFRCEKCHSIYRVLPDYILPYKQYEKEIIVGVIDGLISSDTLGYEDYPCEMTMTRWKDNVSRKLQLL